MTKRIAHLSIIVVAALATLALTGCTNAGTTSTPAQQAPPQQTAPEQAAPQPSAPAEVFAPESPGKTESATKLKTEDLKVGTGPAAQPNDLVSVEYAGWLADGTEFDSTAKHGGQPFQFTIGAGQVIPGWDQGVAGMKVGGVRKLIIPPDLGYGAQGAGGTIPPNATLVFEVKLNRIN